MMAGAFGLGLRSQHYQVVLRNEHTAGWFEVVSENFIGAGGRPRRILAAIRAQVPLALHGVGLSLGSREAPSESYLRGLRDLAAWLEPMLVSDHLCWTRHGGVNSHDLLPLAYTEETLTLLQERVMMVQERLQRRLYLENPSAYIAFASSTTCEAEFLAELCRSTGCGIILDVNNLYVNAMNLGWHPSSYLAALPEDAVGYMHLAGHSVVGEVRIDTHDALVCADVWALYAEAVRRFPRTKTLLEWDGDVPAIDVLLEELARAKAAHAHALATLPPKPTGESPRPANNNYNGGFEARTRPTAEPWQSIATKFWHLATAGSAVALEDAGTANSILRGGLPTPATLGLNVYANAYVLRIHEVLCDMYPTLTYILGRSGMQDLTRAYLTQHPPHAESIKYVAAALPGFLENPTSSIDGGVPAPLLADIAAFEWAQADIFDAPDDELPPIPPEALGQITPAAWPEVTLKFTGALRLITTTYAVAPVLEAVAAGETPARPAPGTTSYLIYRLEETCEHREISAAAAAVLRDLLAGRRFYPACLRAAATLAKSADAVLRDAVQLLSSCATWRLLLAISCCDTTGSHANPTHSVHP